MATTIVEPAALREGTPQWWQQIVVHAMRSHEFLDRDIRPFVKACHMLQVDQGWSKAGFVSWEACCWDGMGVNPDKVQWLIEAEERFADRPEGEQLSLAEAKAKAPERRSQGRPSKEKNHNKIENIMVLQGDDLNYLAARIMRDAPEVFEKLEDYPSMQAAAREAGIVKDKRLQPWQKVFNAYSKLEDDQKELARQAICE